MKYLLLFLCLLVAGCSVTADVNPHQPPNPGEQHDAATLGELTAALARRIPSSIQDSDFLILVVNDMVSSGDLTADQGEAIKSSLPGIKDKMRKLTVEDAASVRAVK